MSKKQKFSLVKIFISAAFFAFGLFTDNIWLYGAALLLSGYDTIIEAVSGIFHGQMLDENFLMTIASAGAIYCGEYPEAVAVMLFYNVGEFFEHYAVDSSRKSIGDLMDIQADFATKLVQGKEVSVDPEELQLDDIIIIRPGEKVPVDGVIIEGSTTLDTSALTGESLPMEAEKGGSLISGTVNLTGLIKVRVTKVFEDSTVAKILELVENAGNRKAHVEKFITKFSRIYTPAVVAMAVLLAIVPPLVIPGSLFSQWLYRAMIFLVISCPCALVISVPLSMFAGIGAASRQGVLVKGSNYLEGLTDTTIVAFDKTGTLTTGKFSVSQVVSADSNRWSQEDILQYAALAESFSNHPIAKAITSKSSPSDQSTVSDYREIAGKGIACTVDGEQILCGNQKLMDENGIPCQIPSQPGTVIHMAKNHQYLGYILVSDVPRANSGETVSALSKLGIRETVMVTGDKSDIAEKVASEIGVTKVFSQLLPGDKVDVLEKLIDENGKGNLVFVGDGINDAPVLARADIGVAMGAFGSDAAIEAADVVIMTDDISKLATLFRIARKTTVICKENVIFALGVKFAIMGLGVFGLASMWMAVFADVGVAVLAILNSMRNLKV